MARVLIADDHTLFRAGLTVPGSVAALRRDRGIRDGNETLDLPAAAEWDLLVLDINMPDRSGLDILRHVRSGSCGHQGARAVRVPRAAVRAKRAWAGASGYIAKDCLEELLKAVRMVLQGRRYVSDSLAELLLLDLDQADKPLHSLFSDREFQIFGKLRGGPRRLRDRARAVSEREDGQHVPHADPGKDEDEEQRRPDQLRATQRDHPVGRAGDDRQITSSNSDLQVLLVEIRRSSAT